MKLINDKEEYAVVMANNVAAGRAGLASIMALHWEKASPVFANYVDLCFKKSESELPTEIRRQLKKRTYEVTNVTPIGYVHNNKEAEDCGNMAAFSVNKKTYAWFGFVGDKEYQYAKLLKFETKHLFKKSDYTFVLCLYSHKPLS